MADKLMSLPEGPRPQCRNLSHLAACKLNRTKIKKKQTLELDSWPLARVMSFSYVGGFYSFCEIFDKIKRFSKDQFSKQISESSDHQLFHEYVEYRVGHHKQIFNKREGNCFVKSQTLEFV